MVGEDLVAEAGELDVGVDLRRGDVGMSEHVPDGREGGEEVLQVWVGELQHLRPLIGGVLVEVLEDKGIALDRIEAEVSPQAEVLPEVLHQFG